MIGNPSQSRKLTAGSWAALIYAGAMFLALVASQALVWFLPTDGWTIGNSIEGKLLVNIAGIPSDLQPGDVVTEIDDAPILDYLVRGLRFWEYPAPEWGDGDTLRYTVQRGDETLDVDAPLRVIGPAGHILGSLQVAVGVTGVGPALLEVLASIAFALVTVFVFVARPREPASHALLIMGLPFFFQHKYALFSLPILGFPAAVYSLLFLSTWALAILPGFLYLTLVFPTPKWPARRFPKLTPVVVFGTPILLLVGPFLIFPGDTAAALDLQGTLGFGLFAYLVLPLIAIGHSIATVREPVARARLKWVVLGVVGFALGALAFSLGNRTAWSLAISFLQNGGYLMLPVCVAIAIVRHRLFDIDLIIRRTLVYSAVTALLALVFYGSVILLQRLFAGVSGQQSPVALVVSTLAIAALFSPLRRRVQEFVDRRFYRRKYDAQAVLARFAEVARNETDIDRLTQGLTTVVRDAMQPEATSIWLRKS